MSGKTAIRALLNTIHFTGVGRLAAPFFGGVGAVLMLHHVRDTAQKDFSPNAHLTVSPGFLDQLIVDLKAKGYEFVSMDEALERLAASANHDGKRVGRRFLTVTLDDAYRDNKEFAVPVFRKHNVPYTIYAAPGLINGTAHLWWEDLENIIATNNQIVVDFQRHPKAYKTETVAEKDATYAELSEFLTTQVSEQEQRELVTRLATENGIDQRGHVLKEVMNLDELREISSDELCTIGAHTVNHYAIARLAEAEAIDELEHSRAQLTEKLKITPKHFAFPYGMSSAAGSRDFQLAREIGFTSAVTTRHGVLYSEHNNDHFSLPRVSLNGLFQKTRFIDSLLSGIPTRLSNRGGKLNIR